MMTSTAEKPATALLVTVEGLYGSLDVELPGGVPIQTLLATLLQHPALARPSDPSSQSEWTLGLKGGQKFDSANTLENYGVLEGSILLLQPSARWSNPAPVAEEDLSLPNDNNLLVVKGKSSFFSFFKKK